MTAPTTRYDAVPIREAFERTARALARRSDIGRGTAVTTVRMTDGLTCEIAEDDWRLACDMGEKHGGHDTGPNPGVLGRGALGACLTMSIVRFAAREGLTLSCLEVEVQADYDARGENGWDDVPPGYGAVRCVVTVESEAPEAEVARVLALAERHTPYLDVFRRAVPVACEMWILNPQNI